MIYKIVYISFFLMFLLSFSSGCSSEEKDIPDPDSGIPGGDEGSDDGDKETDKVSPFMCTPYNSDKFEKQIVCFLQANDLRRASSHVIQY